MRLADVDDVAQKSDLKDGCLTIADVPNLAL